MKAKWQIIEQKYEIAQLFKNGVKQTKIAKDLDIQNSTVLQCLQECRSRDCRVQTRW